MEAFKPPGALNLNGNGRWVQRFELFLTQVFLGGGVLSAGPNFSTKDRLGDCNSANYASP